MIPPPGAAPSPPLAPCRRPMTCGVSGKWRACHWRALSRCRAGLQDREPFPGGGRGRLQSRPSYELLPSNSASRGPRRRRAPLVSGWRWWRRWRCRCRAGDCAQCAAGCRPNGRTFTAACCTADGRAGPCTDQAAPDRSLPGVIGVCTRRQTKRKRQRNPARRKKCLRHVLTYSARDWETQRGWVGFPGGTSGEPYEGCCGVAATPTV